MYDLAKVVTSGMGVNCYIFWCEETKRGIIVDPGGSGETIVSKVKSLGITVERIVLTHGHFDHIGAVHFLRQKLQIPVAIHRSDAEMLTDSGKNLSCFMGAEVVTDAAEILLTDDEEIPVGCLTLNVLHTPGHTPGGICLWQEGIVFSGDTLFHGSVGRTDFPGGSGQQLLSSIREKLLVLKDETLVYPGHERSTTIGYEKSHNPFMMRK